MAKIGIFIPCYNVEKAIEEVISSFSDEIIDTVDAIVVTDNCSQDQTVAILKGIQEKQTPAGQKLVILKNHENYGLGGTQKIAYQYFLDNGFTHFFIVHGDGQGNGNEIAKSFLEIFEENPDVDLVIASRFNKESDTSSYNRLRMFGNWVFNILTFLCSGHWMTDSGAAIIFIKTETLRKVPFEDLTNSFQFNPELNVLLYNLKGIKVKEVPLRWSDSQDKSNITPLSYCIALLKILLRYRWNKTFLRKKGHQLFHNDSQRIAPHFDIIQ